MNQGWKKFAILIIAATGILPLAAQAQEASENKVKIEDIDTTKAVPGQDVDDIITNNKLRAESGSKSKYSIRSKLTYNGGNIEKPLGEERPDIGGDPSATDVSQLTGEISAKYTIDTKNSLMAGIGVRYITPLQGVNTPKGYNGKKVDADNPYLYYQYLTKTGPVQTVFAAQPHYITQANMVNKHRVADLNLSADNVYELGDSHASVGLYAQVIGTGHNQVNEADEDLYLGLDPYLEYQFSDRFNIRTVFNLWNYHHLMKRSFSLWEHEDLAQSLGIGISITRDIFLYPNVQFVLDHIRADRTNVALTAQINLF